MPVFSSRIFGCFLNQSVLENKNGRFIKPTIPILKYSNVLNKIPLSIVLYLFSPPIGFVGCCRLLNLSYLPCAEPVDNSFLLCAVQTVCKSTESLYCPFHCVFFIIRGGDDKIKFFVPQLGITRAGTINQSLHLGTHGIEINRRCHNNHTCLNHFSMIWAISFFCGQGNPLSEQAPHPVQNGWCSLSKTVSLHDFPIQMHRAKIRHKAGLNSPLFWAWKKEFIHFYSF